MRTGLLLVLTFWSTLLVAETLPDKEAVKSLTESVMVKIAAVNYDEGLDMVKPYLIASDLEFNSLKTQLKLQAPNIEKRFGKSLEAELISIKEVGKSLMLIEYLQKFEKHVMSWKFYYYQPKTGWVLNTLKFDHKINNLF